MRSALTALGVAAALLYTTAPALAVFARTSLLETVAGKSYAQMPDWFKKWEGAGLIRFDDKNGDGLIQHVGDVALNELVVDRDILVLASPEIGGNSFAIAALPVLTPRLASHWVNLVTPIPRAIARPSPS